MDELEDARARVVEENEAFRRVLLQLGQHLQQACTALDPASADDDFTYPEKITPSSLFDSTTGDLFGSTPIMSKGRRAEAALQPSTTSHASTARATILGLLSHLQMKIRAARPAEPDVISEGNPSNKDDELHRARAAAAQETIRGLEEEIGTLAQERPFFFSQRTFSSPKMVDRAT